MCKDARVVKLLDLPEAIKGKYFNQANQLTQNYIINALSVLNQAELNFKQARNRRLHVELALIRLNYLQQAIQVLTDENGTLLKKKSTMDLAQ
jgi:DNA polymerase-3 subunit gamma/tau